MSATKRRQDGPRGQSAFCLHDELISLVPFGRKELDSPRYLRWMNDPQVTRTIGRFDYLLPVTRRKLASYFAALDAETTVFLAIYRNRSAASACRRSGAFVGTLKIYDVDLLARRAALGIVIGERGEWGRGYAQRALRLASDYIFDVLGLRKITAGYVGTNRAMERAFVKCGFAREAVFKDHLYFDGGYVDHVFVSKFRAGR